MCMTYFSCEWIGNLLCCNGSTGGKPVSILCSTFLVSYLYCFNVYSRETICCQVEWVNVSSYYKNQELDVDLSCELMNYHSYNQIDRLQSTCIFLIVLLYSFLTFLVGFSSVRRKQGLYTPQNITDTFVRLDQFQNILTQNFPSYIFAKKIQGLQHVLQCWFFFFVCHKCHCSWFSPKVEVKDSLFDIVCIVEGKCVKSVSK